MDESSDKSKKCQFNSDTCGNYTSWGDQDYVKLSNLTEDLASLFGADIVITECDLICWRCDANLILDELICPKHRFALGKGYRPSLQCKYIKHPAKSRGKGIKVSWRMYSFVKSLDSNFVLGSMICKMCQVKLNALMEEEPMSLDEDDNDPDFIAQKPFLVDKEKLNRRTQLDSLSNSLGTDRVRYQINSNIHDMSSTSLNYFCNIYQQMQNNLATKFCYLVAPGQEEAMRTVLETKQETEGGGIIAHLKEAFESCLTRKARCAVLMLIPKTYSKADVSKIFGCTNYEIQKARDILKQYGTCGEEPNHERVYSRLSFEKACHFIDFLFSTGLLQEVAYGTTKLKFDSGDKVPIADTILNGIREHAVKEYIIFCNERKYESLGRSSLLTILSKMKPHIRRKLAGIDTFVVEGIEAFETLRLCAKTFGNDAETKALLNSIDNSEKYLKARYKLHCRIDDLCSSHCISHALSHPSDKELFIKCENSHNQVCEECLNVLNCIASLKLKLSKLPKSHKKDVAEWEVANAERKIVEWQRHILRGVQQCKARAIAFNKLGPTRALWLRDYAQKVNPSKALEGMTEYFGKRGMTVSVEVFITKVFTTYYKHVYLVALDRCDQGTLETLCIADTVIEEFKKENPQITEVELKSDNAVIIRMELWKLCSNYVKRSIVLSSYNYNEAQLGKDQCDREAAYFKNSVEQWLVQKETHKVSNAKELLNAVFENGGPKNTKMCVLQIDSKIAKLERVKPLTNISYFHSVTLSDDGALYKEFFDIGIGKFFKYNDINFVNGATIVVSWTSSSRHDCPMTYDNRNLRRSFPCPETLCISQFKSEEDLMSHIAEDTHKYVKTKSGMDKALLYYVEQKSVQNISDQPTTSCVKSKNAPSQSFTNIYCQGWARKVRRVRRFTSKQKQFIQTLLYEE